MFIRESPVAPVSPGWVYTVVKIDSENAAARSSSLIDCSATAQQPA